ncbi:MAG TPA: MBL fold metallo-hydrolase [Candidatus Nanoarchaeia archaeon]|nr:MBL fold metallo-hydrolase [Candidatus Nanoarchaeia archaeon]
MVKKFEVGLLATNCYVVNCRETLHTAIIDPGFVSQSEANEVVTFLHSNGLELKIIINTHGHPDHSCGNAVLKETFHVPICIHRDDAYMLGKSGLETAHYFGYDCVSPPADILLEDGGYIKLGDVTLKVLHTPGHSLGSISLIGETEVFTGDALFAGSIGRTDFPGSSDEKMQKSLWKLMRLPDYYTVYPGHGPKTTISEEKRVNPFLLDLV